MTLASEAGWELARELTRQLARVREGAQREALVRELCTATPPDELADVLQAMLEGIGRGETRDAWLAFAKLLAREGLDYDRQRAIYTAARAAGLELLCLILLSSEDAAQRAADPRDFVPDDVLGSMSLGQRKALARRPDPNTIDRLLYDADASVIDILLRNPRLTEPLVVRLAARRPNRAEVLRMIAAQSGWLARRAVQLTLICNPYTPTRLAALLVPLMPPAELRQITNDGNLHPAIRRLAHGLWAARVR